MNVKLLRQIAAVIVSKPAAFDMKLLHSKRGTYVDMGCATAHCICGWAAVLLDESIDVISGIKVFGIDNEQKRRLFWVEGWPSEFAKPYVERKTKAAKARVAAARIEHFIATDGRE